ncbi:Palmitoyltransferase pfa5 [Ophidiomyces ophidiicola]|uniref:Palmitoyltransferase pfa5 n=1 Tax=Ophidiomyces ophidiicola TaxID=1387563 RepID=UPI0020C5A891|nr:Palmitoyltransferase pfa5 [Ophidiomyces ophidiicola]KAI1945441.1 Palmitoyltransferase pfa5 [Ophidiomyces ophidiicola]KAI1972073.1 Palmitoyltransferase pfa5 [Ophidiomyces ophidiicola]KAI2008497.1 Palmitoyltransferase pfa5 [Ophidiomyces ophidiicola]KAI2093229.1 Palmitoyltransferase pfa5 [Ophidiomyces ophidiicola]KAI2164819.1 Palmitoyltransferase pfa5 [Ophidiomyces ophidiicola]
MASEKRRNVAVARVIPVVLAALIAYGSYVFTGPLCINYFIHPPSHHGAPKPRRGLAIGLLIPYYILLIIVCISYLRVLSTILLNPGFLPRGNQWDTLNSPETESKKKRRRSSRSRSRPSSAHSAKQKHQGDKKTETSPYPIDAYGLEAYYCKDIFVCQPDGRPPWCPTCCQWKTDRSHHCSEVDRCVRKLDHFCPWVGGVICENSFKFFLQFLFYTFLFTTFNVTVFSIFVAEYRQDSGYLEVQWLVALGLFGLFFLFSLGMLSSSLHLAWLNCSTIESLTYQTKVWTLAVFISRPKDFREFQSTREHPTPIVIYPGTAILPSSSSASTTTSTGPSREFAILSTNPGENPFDLGSPLANLCDVMGHSVLEWLVPLKHSPCSDHSSQESAYAFGPVVQRLKREAGLSDK